MADNSKYAKALLDYVQMPMAQLGALWGTTPQKMSQALRQEGSNIYNSMKSAVTAPGRALQGQMNPQMMMDENGNIIQDDSRMNQEGMNFALNFMGGGLGSSAVKPSPKGSLGMASIPEYGMDHRPPMKDYGAPLHDLTNNGNVYPEDVYSNKAALYYGDANDLTDKQSFSLAKMYRNKPDQEVTIYRAVPNDKSLVDINAGDWVTINKNYAKRHGENYLDNYKILEKKVKAKDIFTNGDSIHEWGYDPQK